MRASRLTLVLAESAVLGVLGSAIGLLLGTGLAWLALRLLAGDLGGAYFPGVAPTLRFDAGAGRALRRARRRRGASSAAGCRPVWRSASRRPRRSRASATRAAHRATAWAGPALCLVGVLLALAPTVAGLPIAAYLSIACLLLGGIACVPAALGALLRGVRAAASPAGAARARTRAPRTPCGHGRGRRRRREPRAVGRVDGDGRELPRLGDATGSTACCRPTSTCAVAAARAATASSSPPAFAARGARPARRDALDAQRVVSLQLDPQRPAVTLLARPLEATRTFARAARRTASRARGADRGLRQRAADEPVRRARRQHAALPLPDGRRETVFVRGVWRDYARQHGALAIADTDWRRLTGDDRVNDLALWLAPDGDRAQVQAALRRLAGDSDDGAARVRFAPANRARSRCASSIAVSP